MTELNLLVMKKLIHPLQVAKSNIDKISNKISGADLIVLNGLFTMGFAYYESALNDCLNYYFLCFPKKLDFKKLNFSNPEKSCIESSLSYSKGDLFNKELIELEIEKKISAISYLNTEEYIKNVIKILSISFNENELEIDKLLEFKETRNLLIHNNLKINYKYIEKTGTIKRGQLGYYLSIDEEYLTDCINYLSEFLQKLISRLEKKYSKFTRLKVLKDLWAFLFKSQIMNFSDFWEYDNNSDCIVQYKKDVNPKILSSGEKQILSIWFSLYSTHSIYKADFNFRLLDMENRKKVLYLLSIVDYINFAPR